MGLCLAFLSFTAATTLGTGLAALLWARFVGRGMEGREFVRPVRHAGDIRTW